MLENKQSGLLHKLGLNGREISFKDNEPLRFFKPTLSSGFSLGRKGEKKKKWKNEPLSLIWRISEKYFNDWNKILLDKDEKERMDKFAVISRDDLTRRKVADEMKMATERQAKYESQLKKMGIPVIVGLVSRCHPNPPISDL